MRAFTDTIETKEQALASARSHRDLDMLIKGTYEHGSGEKFKGCSVGCTYKPFEGKVDAPTLHALSEPVHGIPRAMTRLRDTIFEGLPGPKSKDWHVNFVDAIPAGADLSLVSAQFMHWLMTDPEGVRKHASAEGLAAIDTIAALYDRVLKGETPSEAEWKAAQKAADAAAYAAAYAAARAADAAAFERMAAKLLELLAGAPVHEKKEAA